MSVWFTSYEKLNIRHIIRLLWLCGVLEVVVLVINIINIEWMIDIIKNMNEIQKYYNNI